MTTTNDDKVRENRLRRLAVRRGIRLLKSRRRDTGAVDYGRYWLIDPWNNNAVLFGGQWGATLDDVEDHLVDLTHRVHEYNIVTEQERRQDVRDGLEYHRRMEDRRRGRH